MQYVQKTWNTMQYVQKTWNTMRNIVSDCWAVAPEVKEGYAAATFAYNTPDN